MKNIYMLPGMAQVIPTPIILLIRYSVATVKKDKPTNMCP